MLTECETYSRQLHQINPHQMLDITMVSKYSILPIIRTVRLSYVLSTQYMTNPTIVTQSKWNMGKILASLA